MLSAKNGHKHEVSAHKERQRASCLMVKVIPLEEGSPALLKLQRQGPAVFSLHMLHNWETLSLPAIEAWVACRNNRTPVDTVSCLTDTADDDGWVDVDNDASGSKEVNDADNASPKDQEHKANVTDTKGHKQDNEQKDTKKEIDALSKCL